MQAAMRMKESLHRRLRVTQHVPPAPPTLHNLHTTTAQHHARCYICFCLFVSDMPRQTLLGSGSPMRKQRPQANIRLRQRRAASERCSSKKGFNPSEGKQDREAKKRPQTVQAQVIPHATHTLSHAHRAWQGERTSPDSHPVSVGPRPLANRAMLVAIAKVLSLGLLENIVTSTCDRSNAANLMSTVS